MITRTLDIGIACKGVNTKLYIVGLLLAMVLDGELIIAASNAGVGMYGMNTAGGSTIELKT